MTGIRWSAALLVAASLLAGCSSGEDTTTVTDTSPSPSSTVSSADPEPTIMTKKQAGIYYMTVVCPSNKSMYALWDRITGKYEYEVDIAKFKAAARAHAKLVRESAAALQNPPLKWPKNVQRDALAVSKSDLARVTYYNRMGQVSSWSELVSLSNEPAAKGDNRSAEQIRLTLGLPAAGRCPEWAEKAKKPTMERP